MQHFHRPENRNDRFMASLTEQEQAILRDVERPLLYSTKQQRQQQQLQEQQGADGSQHVAQTCLNYAGLSGAAAQ
jgi:hypothetical protein